MALIVGAIVNMTSTLPTQAHHGHPVLSELRVWDANMTDAPTNDNTVNALASTDSEVANACGDTDYNCTVNFKTGVKRIYLRAIPGDPHDPDLSDGRSHDDANYLAKLGQSADFPYTTDLGQTGPHGLQFDLAEGDNVFRVKVQSRTSPGVFQEYVLTVNREVNSVPAFAAKNGIANPAKNNRFVYGYAEDLMEYKTGVRTGTDSRYNHPSDGAPYVGTTENTYFRKNADTGYFVRGGTDFTTTTEGENVVAFRTIINAGTDPERAGTDGSQNRRDTRTVNLTNGIVITAGQPLGVIALPRASGGNGPDGHEYSLRYVGVQGNERERLPDGLTAQFIVLDTSENTTVDGDITAAAQNLDVRFVTVNYNADNDGLTLGNNDVAIGMRLTSGTGDDAPKTDSENSASKSTHTMVYRVHDGDGDTADSDSEAIIFDITIQKGLVTTPSTPGDDPQANELASLMVDPAGSAVTNTGYSPRQQPYANMDPKTFDSDTTLYRVSIPYEVEDVTITAKAVDPLGSTLRVISDSGNPIVPATGIIDVSELSEGSNAPILIRVEPPADSGLQNKTYSVVISRDYNTPAQFDASGKPNDLNFYDRVKIDPVELPGGRLGNGAQPDTSALTASSNPALLSGDWRYDLALAAQYNESTPAGTGKPGFPYVGSNDDTPPDPDRNTRSKPDPNNWLPSTLGFTFDIRWDAESETVKRELTGTPMLGINAGRSASSEYEMLYVAKDGDLDDSAGDNAEHKFTITVWRNILLQTLTVDETPATAGASHTVYSRTDTSIDHSDYTDWNKDRKYEYSFTVDHDIDQVVVEATTPISGITGLQGVAVVTKPDDADADTDRHEVNLKDGNNVVTIEVTNGDAVGTHELTIYRRPLGANPITVTTVAGNEKVKLTPGFNVETLTYNAEVESHQDIVTIAITPTHTNAQVSVENIDAGRSRSREVDVDPGMNRYRVDVTLGSSVTTYWLNINRKGNVAPNFGSADVMDSARQVGKQLKSCDGGTEMTYIELPKATEGSGNGALAYSIDATTLPEGVSFDPQTRQLKGTPVLREAYERSYEIAYVVSDNDTDTSSTDTDTITFTMTITNDKVDPCGDTGTGTPAAKNLLTNLLVIYDLAALNKTDVEFPLTPEFDSNTLTYTVDLPYGSSNKRIAAYVHTGADVSINKVRVPHGVHTPLRDGDNTIRVSYPEQTSTNYSLTVTEAAQSLPVLSESVPDQTWQAGKAITAMSLPVASGGNVPLTYSLADHEGGMPSGLAFDAATRVLSGTPSLSNVDSAETAIYKMTYTVVDRDGDTDTKTFRITITTDPVDVANPGSTPMKLNVIRSGTSATLTWNAGDDASKQAVVALQLDDVAGTVKLEEIAADAETYTFTGLQTGVYMFFVVGYDSSGNYKDASGLYSASDVE